MKESIVMRTGTTFSAQLSTKVIKVWSVLCLCTFILIAIHIGVGEYDIPFTDVFKTLLGIERGSSEFIIYTLRLPRALTGLLVGMALASAGAIIQGILRNPLASPGVLGFNSGAALAAVSLMVLYPESSVAVRPIAAFAGALLTVFIVYLLAYKKGSSPVRMLLVGMGVAAIAHALITLVMTFGKIHLVSQANIWMVGSVYGTGWEQFWPLFLWVVILLPLAVLMARHLNVMELGEEISVGLGMRLEWKRVTLLLLCVGLAGAAVAVAGTISFVGLMAPHMARRLVGPTHGALIPTAALMGGLLIVTADLAGRMILAPIEIPVGVITAIIGAPYFIYLLLREAF